jgi:hypothetical protein
MISIAIASKKPVAQIALKVLEQSGSFFFNVGPAVGTIWLLLLLGRKWRISGWLDWLGTALGITWIVTYIVGTYVRVAWG